jgi:hypothetical protein
MKIVETREISDVLQLIPFEIRIGGQGYDLMPVKNLLAYLADKFDHDPDFHFYIFLGEDDAPIAYTFFTIQKHTYEKALFLERIWRDENHPFMVVPLLRLLNRIARENGIRTLKIKITKPLLSAARAWGFKQTCAIMESDKLLVQKRGQRR